MRTHMRARKKDIKKISLDFLKNINLQIFNLNISRWLTFFGSIAWIIWLFMPWIVINDKNIWKIINYNSFSAISWNVGFLIIIMLFVIILLVFWWNYKEKMKLYSDIDLKSYIFILFVWSFIILSGIMCVSFSVWLEVFWWKDVKYWSWVIFTMVSAFFIFTWWYLTRKDFYKNSSEIILEKLNKERNKEKSKENISLPF